MIWIHTLLSLEVHTFLSITGSPHVAKPNGTKTCNIWFEKHTRAANTIQQDITWTRMGMSAVFGPDCWSHMRRKMHSIPMTFEAQVIKSTRKCHWTLETSKHTTRFLPSWKHWSDRQGWACANRLMSARRVERGCISSSISSWSVNPQLQVNLVRPPYEVQVSLTMHGRAQGVKGTLHRRSREARS